MPVASCFNSLLISGLHFPEGYSFCINKTSVTDTLKKMEEDTLKKMKSLTAGKSIESRSRTFYIQYSGMVSKIACESHRRKSGITGGIQTRN